MAGPEGSLPQMAPMDRALISSEPDDDIDSVPDGILGTLINWRIPLGRPCASFCYCTIVTRSMHYYLSLWPTGLMSQMRQRNSPSCGPVR